MPADRPHGVGVAGRKRCQCMGQETPLQTEIPFGYGRGNAHPFQTDSHPIGEREIFRMMTIDP